MYTLERDMRQKNIDVFLYAFGNAAGNYHCELGPIVLKKALEKTCHSKNIHWFPEIKTDKRRQQNAAVADVAKVSQQLAHAVQHAVHNHHCFITLGGDHSAAIGSWSGAATATKEVGLIWFDAHMDSHTFATTPSNNIHGMPLAILLGMGDTQLTHILSDKPKLKPENVALIGVRSYESGEAQLLASLGVKIFYMEDIKALGMRAVIQQSLNIVTKNTTAFGISIDLDGFDPMDAPGVGSCADNGIRALDFLPAFQSIVQHSQFIGADIVEFNPALDVAHKTEKLVIALFMMILK